MAVLHGKAGSVEVGGTLFAFDRWSAPMKNEIAFYKHFGSGYRKGVAGTTSGEVDCEGPYNSGAMALTVGNSYEVECFFTDVLKLTFPTILESVTPEVDMSKEQRVKAVFQSVNDFTAAIT